MTPWDFRHQLFQLFYFGGGGGQSISLSFLFLNLVIFFFFGGGGGGRGKSLIYILFGQYFVQGLFTKYYNFLKFQFTNSKLKAFPNLDFSITHSPTQSFTHFVDLCLGILCFVVFLVWVFKQQAYILFGEDLGGPKNDL